MGRYKSQGPPDFKRGADSGGSEKREIWNHCAGPCWYEKDDGSYISLHIYPSSKYAEEHGFMPGGQPEGSKEWSISDGGWIRYEHLTRATTAYEVASGLPSVIPPVTTIPPAAGWTNRRYMRGADPAPSVVLLDPRDSEIFPPVDS